MSRSASQGGLFARTYSDSLWRHIVEAGLFSTDQYKENFYKWHIYGSLSCRDWGPSSSERQAYSLMRTGSTAVSGLCVDRAALVWARQS